jgi:hypothetical protein
MKLKWTRKKPRTRGYYWYKAAITRCVSVVYVHITHYDERYIRECGCLLDGHISEYRGQWAGPLPEPPKD